ncbi:MAG: FAD-dependent oxidoreductase [Okeania sp. SIO3I5]|uniref:FAD-dependent oxidoreductase n=1 Tax=Okeania sp. SIO3I5 TaxID=2607805 RepID=UPI0013B77303|nr:FAD-dependent oxidoreductase [Okeania sp. SIO3I5]NEQ39659.1 FAD-dependent oxidoreductase [Okeania sp. SIO3I5]
MFHEQLFNIPLEAQQKIAIIGGGAMGISLASILSQLGIAKVTLLEAESIPLNHYSASLNNTGILHHFVYGGHFSTLELLFKQTILFKKVMPDYVFEDNYVNYVAPNIEGNTAIYQKGVTLKDVSKNLMEIYKNHINNYPSEQIFGSAQELVQQIDTEEILWGTGDKNSFNGAVKVKQPVLNIGEYCSHLSQLLNELIKEQKINLQTNHRVTNIELSDRGFKLKINHEENLYFNTVINTGYAGGLEIPIPSFSGEKEVGNIVKLKVYGLYKIPENLKNKIPQLIENFSSTLLIRGQYAGIIKAGEDRLAIFYGLEYDQAELYIPLAKTPFNLPQNWISWIRDETNYFGNRNETSILQAIQQGVSQWIPWVGQLEPIKLKKNLQVYPGQKPANELEVAKRDHNPIRYHYQHQTGEQYIHIPGAKLTSVVYHSFLIIHKLLQTYINKGILTEQEVKQHLIIDNNRTIIISPKLESLLGKGLPQSPPEKREKVMRELNVY